MLAGCPFHCDKNYRVFDPTLGKFIPCPSCVPKLKEQVKKPGSSKEDENLKAEKGISCLYYDWSSVVSKITLTRLDKESVADVKATIDMLLSVLSDPTGMLDRSYCIGVTEKGHPDKVSGPLIAAAQIGGHNPSRLYFASDYQMLLCNDRYDEVTEIQETPILIMQIEMGVPRSIITSIKGLLDKRAQKSLPTIFVTTCMDTALSMILSWKGEVNKDSCEGHFLRYEQVEKLPISWYMQGIREGKLPTVEEEAKERAEYIKSGRKPRYSAPAYRGVVGYHPESQEAPFTADSPEAVEAPFDDDSSEGDELFGDDGSTTGTVGTVGTAGGGIYGVQSNPEGISGYSQPEPNSEERYSPDMSWAPYSDEDGEM